MKTCKVCGKQIPNRLTYCSDECAEKDKASINSQQNRPVFVSQWDKGHGSVRREQNIRRVMDMLKQGVPEEEIRFQLSILFRDMTVDSYIRTAKEWIKREGKGS